MGALALKFITNFIGFIAVIKGEGRTVKNVTKHPIKLLHDSHEPNSQKKSIVIEVLFLWIYCIVNPNKNDKLSSCFFGEIHLSAMKIQWFKLGIPKSTGAIY